MSEAADAFDLSFERRPEYMFATLACRRLDPAMALEILGEIMERAADMHCKRVMVQCDLTGIENDTDLLQAMLELASMRSGTRVAFINCRDSKFEHPAISDDFKLFDDQETGEKWLLANSG